MYIYIYIFLNLFTVCKLCKQKLLVYTYIYIYIYMYTENTTNRKQQLPFVRCKQYIETTNSVRFLRTENASLFSLVGKR